MPLDEIRRERTLESPRDEVVAAPAIAAGPATLVPVLRVAAEGAAAARGRVGASSVRLSGCAELVGVWLDRPPAAPTWLPACATPSGAATWSAWLAARPELLQAIEARLERARRTT